jgi:hypothetical protein
MGTATNTQRRDRGEPGDEQRRVGPRAGEHHERGERGHVAAARHVPGRRGDGRHRVVLERAELRAREARRSRAAEEREREDAGGDRDAEAPARLEDDVQVRERHHAAEHAAREGRAEGELGGVGLVHLGEPAALGVGGRAGCSRCGRDVEHGRSSVSPDRLEAGSCEGDEKEAALMLLGAASAELGFAFASLSRARRPARRRRPAKRSPGAPAMPPTTEGTAPRVP